MTNFVRNTVETRLSEVDEELAGLQNRCKSIKRTLDDLLLEVDGKKQERDALAAWLDADAKSKP